MLISALLLILLAVCACAAASRAMFRALGLDPMETLMWLGLAEVPAPPTRRRREAAHRGRGASAA